MRVPWFDWIEPLGDLAGWPLVVAAVVLILLIGGVIGRYYVPSGKDRLAATVEEKKERRRVEDNQLEQQRIWFEKQLEDLKDWYEKQITELRSDHEKERKEDRVELATVRKQLAELEARFTREEKWNREYRHALANREHLLGFAYDSSLELIDMMLEEWAAAPGHFRRQRHHMKTSNEMRQSIPLPAMPAN